MGGIFISYRREDSRLYAGRLRDTLSNHFGEEQVFRDIDTINPGERFPRVIEEAVGSCDALLALIGPTWLSIKDDAGRRRLDDSDDYVRLEIATALGRGDDVLVIPVLVGATAMPAAADMPKPLASLAEFHAVALGDESWDERVARLTRELEKKVKPRVVAPRLLHLAPGPPAAANPILSWLWRKLKPDVSGTALIGYADTLADAVSRRETVLLDQLRGGRDMVVDDLEFRAEPRLRLGADDAAGVLADIGPYFRRQETRRMVVLGEAGAGKTVLVVRLVLDQLRHRATADAARAGEPVPVRINSSGWDGSADFTAWLSNQLATDYGLNTRVARAMVDSNLILPVLDGLDEMDAPGAEPVLAAAALDRLNEPPWRNRAVVVACRSTVYTAIRELRGDAGLQFATTVTLQPFSAEDIYIHLQQYRDELGVAEGAWAPVTDQLEQANDGVLATALRTPWMLSLAATALPRGGHQTAVELAACHDTAQIRQILFASLIPAAVESTPRTGGTRSYNEQDVQRWLRALARHLEQRRRTAHSGGTQISLDQIWRLAGADRCRLLHAAIVGFIGLAAGFAMGLQSSGGVLAGGIALGLAAGIGAGLRVLMAGDVRGPKRFARRVPGRSRWRRGLKRGLLIVLPLGIPLGIIAPLVWLSRGARSDELYGFVGTLTTLLELLLIFGLAFGLLSGLGTTPEERLALGQDAERVIHQHLVSLLMAGMVWVAVGLTIFPVMWFGQRLAFVYDEGRTPPEAVAAELKGWPYWLLDGLIGGLNIGLTFAVVSALLSVTSGRYAVASVLFGSTGIFPRRPARFLEWARNSGLLRVTGVAYQFRHDTYQQWLAAGDVDRSVKTTFDAQAS